jgi:peptidoglycan/xylan/chitin deacetylase (PgdA/CDA1 family)
MSEPTPPIYRTSLLLILLTLLTGMALGWLLRDTLRGPAAQAPLPATQAVAAITPISAPSAAPTSALQATATAIPRAATATQAPAPALQPTTDHRPPTTDEIVTSVPSPIPHPPSSTAVDSDATAIPSPIPHPPSPESAGYIGHVVAEGETLETIAQAAGSTPELISRYNRLVGPPPVGRALVIPRLAGQNAALASAPLLVSKGRADKPWVALTLDAGASAEPVPRMLVALRERNIKITFFLTGKWIADNPELTRAIVADGHEIANHTYNHPDLTRMGAAAMRAELADTEALLQKTAGASSRPLFRPPYGAYDEQVLRTAVDEGYLPIYWTLDSLDSVGEPKTPEFLLERVTRKLTPEQLRGAIILAHCGSAPTADALPQILDRFKEMGFEVKKVSEVLG